MQAALGSSQIAQELTKLLHLFKFALEAFDFCNFMLEATLNKIRCAKANHLYLKPPLEYSNPQ